MPQDVEYTCIGFLFSSVEFLFLNLIYTSMIFPFLSFGICTLLYAGAAVMGYTMFGEAILSQFTLNLPQELVATKIAVWTTVYILYFCVIYYSHTMLNSVSAYYQFSGNYINNQHLICFFYFAGG